MASTTDTRLFGIPLSEDITKQLQYRKDLISGDEYDIRNTMLKHNRGAWVTLTSSVNLKSEERAKYEESLKKYSNYWAELKKQYKEEYKKNNNSVENNLAQTNVLSGGTLYSDITTNKLTQFRKTGIRFDDNATFNEFGNKSSYVNTQEFGIKPMPGITNFKIKSKSTYGSLREVELEIKVWDQKQLSIIETLYFRPGFNMLVEFGAASYIDKDGEVITNSNSLSQHFLAGTPLKTIREKIKDKKEKSGYNYEAIVAKVINFSWNFNNEGGYDCTLKLMSLGEVIESVSATNYDQTSTRDYNILGSAKDQNDVLLNSFKKLKNFGDHTDGSPSANLAPFQKEFGLDDKNGYIFISAGITAEEVDEEGNTSTKTSREVFMSLLALLELINKRILDPLNIDQKDTSKKVSFKLDPSVSEYVTFTSNISGNPYICSVPYDDSPTGAYASAKSLYGALNSAFSPPFESKFATSKFKREFKEKFNHKSPYFILINIQHLIETQRSFLEDQRTNADKVISIFTFVKKILTDISSALGGIAVLDLHQLDGTNEWIVIDRNLYNPVDKANDLPIVDLVGLNSIVSQISLDSKISSQIANALSIAAAAGNGGTGTTEGLFKFNEYLEDRYATYPSDNPELNPKEPTYTQVVKAGDKIREAYKTYTKIQGGNKRDPGAFTAMSADHRFYMQAVRRILKSREREKNKPQGYDGLIPIDLNVTLEGIAGIKPGEAFGVGGNIMPERYNGKVGFVVTQVNHDIGADNRWTTSLTTKMFILPDVEAPKEHKEEDEAKKEDKKESNNKERNDSKVQANLRAEYGEPGIWDQMESVTAPTGFNLTYDGKPVKSIRMHKKVASNLKNALQETLNHYGSDKLKELRINVYNGSYNNRAKRGGTTKSTHAWTIAVDFDAQNNKLKWKKDKAEFAKPEYKKFIEIFKKNGFFNLGDIKNYDYMHFQAWDPTKPE